MRTRLHRWMTYAMVLGLLASPWASSPFVGAAHGATPEKLGYLVSQDQFVAGVEGAAINLSLAVSTDASSPPTSIVVTAHRTVDERDAVEAAIAGDLPPIVDSLRFPVGAIPSTGLVELSVPIEIGTRGPERLQMSATGIYPLTISFEVDSTVVDRLVTFVERLPDGATSPEIEDPLPVAIVGSVDGKVTLRPDSTTAVDAGDRSAISDLLDAIDSLPGTPLNLALRPELVEGLTRSSAEDADLHNRLQFADSLSLLSTPYVHIEPGESADSDIADIFTGQLRRGEDALSGSLPLAVPRRTAWIQNESLSATGAQFIRDLGFRSLLLTPSALTTDEFGSGAFADPTRLIDVDLGNSGSIPAIIADPALAAILTTASDGPASDVYLAAQHVLAEIKVLRRRITTDEGAVRGRAVVLTTDDGSLMSTDLLVALADTLGASGEVSLVGLDDALSASEIALVDGRPIRIGLPSTLPPTLSSPAAILYLTAARINAFTSMLPDGDERPDMWRRLLDVIPDTRLSDAERQAYADVVTTETLGLAEQVAAPVSTTFTLGARASSIRLALRNDSDSDLRVRVRLTSSKLRFPEGESVFTLTALATTSIEIPVEARSNGRFPVTIQLLTPDGDLPVSRPTVFTARVNALAGLGQLVTGIALLLLAAWWLQHLRRQQERKEGLVTNSARRHPSGDSSEGAGPAN